MGIGRLFVFDPAATFSGGGSFSIGQQLNTAPEFAGPRTLGAGYQVDGETRLGGFTIIDGPARLGANLWLDDEVRFRDRATVGSVTTQGGILRFEAGGELVVDGSFESNGVLDLRGGVLRSSGEISLFNGSAIGSGLINADLHIDGSGLEFLPGRRAEGLLAPGPIVSSRAIRSECWKSAET